MPLIEIEAKMAISILNKLACLWPTASRVAQRLADSWRRRPCPVVVHCGKRSTCGIAARGEHATRRINGGEAWRNVSARGEMPANVDKSKYSLSIINIIVYKEIVQLCTEIDPPARLKPRLSLAVTASWRHHNTIAEAAQPRASCSTAGEIAKLRGGAWRPLDAQPDI